MRLLVLRRRMLISVHYGLCCCSPAMRPRLRAEVEIRNEIMS